MDRICVVLLAGWLAVTGATPVAAQTEAIELRRVEIPELGVAVSLPAEWDVVVPMLALGDQVDPQVVAMVGEEMAAHIRAVMALQASHGPEYPEPGAGLCMVGAALEREPMGERFRLADVLATNHLAFWNDPDFETTAAELELPVGHANHVHFVEHDYDGDWIADVYQFVLAEGFGWLLCSTFESAPDDDWLPLAETLELLPDGPVAAPSYEIHFPEQWEIGQPTLARATQMLAAFSPDRRPLVRPRLVADSPDESQSCSLFDWSSLVEQPGGYRDLADALSGDILAMQEAEGQEVVDSAFVDLPYGWAARVDIRLGGELELSRWHVTEGSSWFYLVCASREPPADRWRSIAETFRFVDEPPAHEGPVVADRQDPLL